MSEEAQTTALASVPTRLKQILSRVALGVFTCLGIVPLVYFAITEYSVAEQALDSSTPLESPAAENHPASRDPLERGVRNLSFGVGEDLQFDINYGFINAGSAHMRVLDLVEWEGRPCYYIQTQAHSNSFFDSIFPVNDTVESIIDRVGLCSWHFEKRLREGSYSSDRIYTFDQINQYTVYEGDTLEIPAFVQDVLSAFYYVRTLDLKIGESIFIDNFTRGKTAQLEVRVLRKEKIEVPAGEFDCIVVEPLLQAAGVFRHEGRLTVWLTDDRLKMPVLMRSKVLVGAINAELTNFRLGEVEP